MLAWIISNWYLLLGYLQRYVAMWPQLKTQNSWSGLASDTANCQVRLCTYGHLSTHGIIRRPLHKLRFYLLVKEQHILEEFLRHVGPELLHRGFGLVQVDHSGMPSAFRPMRTSDER